MRCTDFDGFVLQSQSIELANGPLGVVGSDVVDEAVAQALTCNSICGLNIKLRCLGGI